MSSLDIRKAAVLLMSLPKEAAGQLMGKLTPQQNQLVSVEIAKIDLLSGDEQDSAINDFVAASQGSFSEANPFGFLREVDSRNVLNFVIDEHPQTVALILSHLQPAQAAAIIGGLPVERRGDVVRGIASLRQINPEILQEVEQSLRYRMSSVVGRQADNEGGAQSAAAILDLMDRATAGSLLDNLAHKAPDLVEEIRGLLDDLRTHSAAA